MSRSLVPAGFRVPYAPFARPPSGAVSQRRSVVSRIFGRASRSWRSARRTSGLIRRDLLLKRRLRRARRSPRFRCAPDRDERASGRRHFLNDTLPLDPGRRCRRPSDYVEQLSRHDRHAARLVRRNMRKIAGVLDRDADGAARPDARTRSLACSIPALASTRPGGQFLSADRVARHRAAEQLARRARAVGAGDRAEDAAGAEAGQRRAVDAVRIIQALMKAGVPADAFSYYPADHAGADEILRPTGRSMFFGDVVTIGALEGRSPHRSCTARATARSCIGPDAADDWEQSRSDRRIDRRTTAADRASTPRACG